LSCIDRFSVTRYYVILCISQNAVISERETMSKSSNRTGRNHFKHEWLERIDDNGDKVGSHISKSGEFNVKCDLCKTEISVGNLGFTAIKRHSARKVIKELLIVV